MSTFVPPQPDDVLQWVTVRLHANGTLSTSGTIADKKMALHLLDQAKDAIKRQVPDYKAIIVPNGEVEVALVLPVKEMGVIPPGLRGDP